MRAISGDQDDMGEVLSESLVNEDAAALLAEVQNQNRQLHTLNNKLTTQVSTLKVEVSELNDKLRRETERVDEVWRVSYDQVFSFDETIVAREEEIGRLRARIAELKAFPLSVSGRGMHATPTELLHAPAVGHSPAIVPLSPHMIGFTARPVAIARGPDTILCRGKASPVGEFTAPPVGEFTGEDPDCNLDDLLPPLERAIVGHLKSHALQEWKLLEPDK